MRLSFYHVHIEASTNGVFYGGNKQLRGLNSTVFENTSNGGEYRKNC